MKSLLQIFLTTIFVLSILTFGFAQQNQYIIDLDGTESFYVKDDASNHLDVSNAYTFECWICVKSYQQFDRIMDRRHVFSFTIIAPKGSGDYGVRFSEMDDDDNVVRSIETNDESEDMNLNTWYHVAVTFDGSDCRLYVNGNLVGLYHSIYWDLSPSSTALNIGGKWWGSYKCQIDACIDEVRVSDIARSISEMQTTTSSDEYTSDSHTVLLMHLDDQADPPSYISGTGLTGTRGDDDIDASDYVAWNACCGGNDLSLPVELTSFTAAYAHHAVHLQWQTASEVENLGFVILRSLTGTDPFNEIASYQTDPALRGAGNSSQAHHYAYTDVQVVPNQTYWYKLVDVNLNGTRTEHPPISVKTTGSGSDLISEVGGGVPKAFALYQNYPNPFNPETKIKFDVPATDNGSSKVILTVYDLNGKKVRTLFADNLDAGHYSLKWDGTNAQGQKLNSGMYLLNLKAGNYSQTVKMIILR